MRFFDIYKGIIFFMRNKEELVDYCYFKDLDLYFVFIDEKFLKEV